MMKTNRDRLAARQERGQINENELAEFALKSSSELLTLLNSGQAAQRTVAARLLGERKCPEAIRPLCNQLQNDKALYARISASEALTCLNRPAIPALMGLLGKIGDNQYRQLPDEGFYKKSYPLPRDLAARTLARMNADALDDLCPFVFSGERESVLELLDAIGFLSFYAQDLRAKEVIIKKWDQAVDDALMQWKLIRCLQAFPSDETRQILEDVTLNSPLAVLRWEGARCLGLTQTHIRVEIRTAAFNDENMEVRKVAERFLNQDK